MSTWRAHPDIMECDKLSFEVEFEEKEWDCDPIPTLLAASVFGGCLLSKVQVDICGIC
jgi:hypothetical protein